MGKQIYFETVRGYLLPVTNVRRSDDWQQGNEAYLAEVTETARGYTKGETIKSNWWHFVTKTRVTKEGYQMVHPVTWIELEKQHPGNNR